MKELKYSCVDEFARWIETTHDDEASAQIQIQTLLRHKDHLSNLKTRLIEKSKTSSCAPSLMGSPGPPLNLAGGGGVCFWAIAWMRVVRFQSAAIGVQIEKIIVGTEQ